MTKRSEAAKKLTELLFLGSGYKTETEVFEVLGRLGIEWPKEEPELPEKISLCDSGSKYRLVDRADGDGYFWAQLDTEPYDAIPMERRKAIAEEAIRRYNVVGEVVREMEAEYPIITGDVGRLSGSSKVLAVYARLKGIEP